MLSLNRLEELGVAYDWRTSSLMWMKSEWILASIEPWNGINAIKLDLEKVAKLKDKSKDNNNDNLSNISESPDPHEPSESSELPEPFDEPPEPAGEPDQPDEQDESDDAEIDDEHPSPQTEYHSERAAARERPDDRALVGYAALREHQEEDTLKQRCCYTTLKAGHFASKHDNPKTYRVARYNSKWEEWKPAVGKQMREFDIHCDWVNLLKGLGRLADVGPCPW
jgi:hypothetical protein